MESAHVVTLRVSGANPSTSVTSEQILSTLERKRARPLQKVGTEFENNYSREMCSGSEAGSDLRLIDFVCHSPLGVRVIKKKKERATGVPRP